MGTLQIFQLVGSLGLAAVAVGFFFAWRAEKAKTRVAQLEGAAALQKRDLTDAQEDTAAAQAALEKEKAEEALRVKTLEAAVVYYKGELARVEAEHDAILVKTPGGVRDDLRRMLSPEGGDGSPAGDRGDGPVSASRVPGAPPATSGGPGGTK